MAFLDNSGDIILDAVLTDTGRMRLAKGDGSFRIVKYAFGDDEIDYGLYDKNNSGGSAYYALTILQTPVLEAFANNASSMKYKLMSLDRKDLLYLPIFKLCDVGDSARFSLGSGASTYIIMVDKTTADTVVGTTGAVSGVLDGYQPKDQLIRMDQGLNTIAISQDLPLDSDLIETQYMLQMDNRLGFPVSPTAAGKSAPAALSFVDDDNIASYSLTLGTDSSYISELSTIVDSSGGGTLISGPLGTRLSTKVMASTTLRTSSDLFNKLGSVGTMAIGGLAAADHKFIDSTISVVGQVTGYRIDIPVRYVKKV